MTPEELSAFQNLSREYYASFNEGDNSAFRIQPCLDTDALYSTALSYNRSTGKSLHPTLLANIANIMKDTTPKLYPKRTKRKSKTPIKTLALETYEDPYGSSGSSGGRKTRRRRQNKTKKRKRNNRKSRH